MMNMSDIYIWRDSVDVSTYLIGVRYGVEKNNGKNQYMAWGAFPIDAIGELFGNDLAKFAKSLNLGEPRRIRVSVQIITD